MGQGEGVNELHNIDTPVFDSIHIYLEGSRIIRYGSVSLAGYILILVDGSSECGAHAKNRLGKSICDMQLFTSSHEDQSNN